MLLVRALALVVVLLDLGGCSASAPDQLAMVYPPTNQVDTFFASTQVPQGCRVFAQLLASVPARATGQSMRDAMITEARSKGATAVLIGQGRESVDEVAGFEFRYHGPEQEYLCGRDGCWRFGDRNWTEQGSYVSLGYTEWGNAEMKYDFPVRYKAMFLRCP